MPDIDIITRKLELQRFRERRLDQENRGTKPILQEQDNNDEFAELAQNFAKVAAKGRRIRDLARGLAVVRRVPVPADAVGVRAAVRRRDEESDGSYITFDLYSDALANLRKRRAALSPEILDDLTGDPTVDAERITARITATVEDLTIDQAKLLGSQVLILVVLKLLQLGMDSLADSEQSSKKRPPGTEVPVVAAQIALSIAAQQIYTALTQEEADNALKELGVNIPPLDMAAAKEQLKNMPLFQAALVKRKPSDFETIVRFVNNFLDRQTDPGWETWQAMGLVEEAIDWAAESAEQLAASVRPVSTDSQNPEDVGSFSQPFLDAIQIRASKSSLSGYVGPRHSDEVRRIYDKSLKKLNKFFDKIGSVLGSSIGIEDVCCFVRWLQVLGTDNARWLKTMFQFANNTFDKLDELGADGRFSADLNLSTTFHQAIMMLLDEIQQTILSRMRKWLATDEDKWAELFHCRLIDVAIEYVVRSLEKLKQRLVSKLDKYLVRIEKFEKRADSTVDSIGNQRELRTLMAIVDLFLELHGSMGEPCPETADPAQLANAAEKILTAVPPGISIPHEDGDQYETIQSEPVRLSTGIVTPAPPQASAGVTPLEAATEVCAQNRVDRNIVPLPRA